MPKSVMVLDQRLAASGMIASFYIVTATPSQIRLLSFYTSYLHHFPTACHFTDCCVWYYYYIFIFLFFIIGLKEKTVESRLTIGSGVWLGIKLSFLKWQGADLPRWQRAIGRICWQMDTRTELAGCCRRQNAPSHRSVFLSSVAAGKVSLTHSRTAGVWIGICSGQTLLKAFLCRPNWYNVCKNKPPTL